jgi:glutamate transport system permease protein
MTDTRQLYDAVGPAGKRKIRWFNAVALLAVLAVLIILGLELAARGQLGMDKWGAIIDPSNKSFPRLWSFILGGLANTAIAAVLAIASSVVVGIVLGVSRISAHRSYRWFLVWAIEGLRAVPVVLLIFFVYRVLPDLGLNLSTLACLVIGLTLYNGVVIAEIVRAGILALPRGQKEAAQSIGLSGAQTLMIVLLPQALRIMLPALISQLVVVVKETSLGFIISYEELLRRGQIAIQTLDNPLQMFFLIGLIFVLINWGLSLLARRVEQRGGAKRVNSPRAAVRSAKLLQEAG